MAKKYSTTKKDFRVFKTECERLHKKWGLDSDWKLSVWHKECSKNAWAEEQINLEQRILHVTLASSISDKPSISLLRDLARHEMIHCVTEPLLDMSGTRFVSDEVQRTAAHEVLRRLDRLLPR